MSKITIETDSLDEFLRNTIIRTIEQCNEKQAPITTRITFMIAKDNLYGRFKAAPGHKLPVLYELESGKSIDCIKTSSGFFRYDPASLAYGCCYTTIDDVCYRVTEKNALEIVLTNTQGLY